MGKPEMPQPDYERGGVRLYRGDCGSVLSAMAPGSVHCCVTSPPYWGLRDYGEADQLGLEPTPEQYIERMVGIFREVWRVLRDDGTVWLNLGDSYNAHPGQRKATDAPGPKQATSVGSIGTPSRSVEGRKPKDLIGVPWLVAFALQRDGWYLRQDIIWHKPNPMPESVRDRCTKSHEYLFLLSKGPRYYYDGEAIREPATYGEPNSPQSIASPYGQGYSRRAKSGNKARKPATARDCPRDGVAGSVPWEDDGRGRNRRSVWTVTTRPYPGTHFATFPPKLIEPCIIAGCPEGGVVLDPFVGSGTTAAVAVQHGRECVGIDLSAAYLKLAADRIEPVIESQALFEGVAHE